MAQSDSIGEEIFALQSRLRLLRPWVDDLQLKNLARLQLGLDATTGQSTSARALREELRKDVAWRASEIDGCQRALELVPVVAGGGAAPSSPEYRILRKMDRRASEIAELQTEIARLAELERMRSLDFEIAQQRLLSGLRETTSAATAARRADHVLRIRRQRSRAAAPMSADEMWSPTPILGYRIWAIHKGQLFGAWTQWLTNHFLATCEEKGEVPHTDGRCAEVAFGCGVYAAKSVTELMKTHSINETTIAVVGMVAMAGRVVEHAKGYRAEEATVVAAVAIGGEGGSSCSIRLLSDELDIEGLFVDFGQTVRGGEGEQLFPGSTHEMFAMIDTFMTEEARSRIQWT